MAKGTEPVDPHGGTMPARVATGSGVAVVGGECGMLMPVTTRRRLRPPATLALLLALALVGAACSDDDTGTGADGTTTSSSASTTVPGAGDDVDDADLPGEPFDIFPYEGAELMVVGVEADDVLNVRVGPGADFDVVLELGPLEEGIVATGRNRQLDDASIWVEVDAEGETGWGNVSFLLQRGPTNDITAQLWPEPADRPGAETMIELGEHVAALRASDEPPSEVVVVDGPHVGDLGEITVDVIGLGDDAVGGERLHVFAEPLASGEGFQVRTVEATALCTRGVGDNTCV